MKLERLDLFTGVLVTVIWGCNFSVIELGLKSLDPFVLTLLRFTFCAIPLVFFMKKPDNVSYASLATYGVLFGVGLWWVVNFAMYSGLSAGMSSVFLQFSAFFTIIMSRIFLAEAINKVHGIGIFLSISGLLMILYYSEETSTISGILLVLLAAFSWSLCNVIVKMKKPADMVAFIVWSSLFSVPAIFVMTLLFEGIKPFQSLVSDFTWGAGFSIFFQCYITTIFGYKTWNNLMKKYPASAVAPLSLIVPLAGILASYLFFNEHLSTAQFVAITVVFMGIAVFINSSRILTTWEKLAKQKARPTLT